MLIAKELQEKWDSVLDVEGMSTIKDPVRRATTAIMLENSQKNLLPSHERVTLLGEAAIPANFMGSSSSTAGTGGIDTFDPVLITLIRRAMPNLIAYDVCGVQPMTGPSGMIFAMRARYSNQTGNETFYNEVDTTFSSVTSGANTFGQKFTGSVPGNTTVTSNLAGQGVYNTGSGMSTAQGEALGTTANAAYTEMSFSIEKSLVAAKERALKASYTIELAQDLKTVHGLEAESTLADILTAELLAEINREVIRSIIITAKPGSQTNTTTAGIFDLDTDSNGRWSVEKFKGLMFQIEREANKIAKDTRRGKGNIIICSSDVASALQMAGILDYTPALNSNSLNVDDAGNTFAGVLNGRYKVYIDPYATGDYFVVGYKGSNVFDNGLFYCPYIPLQMARAVDPTSFAPAIGFKSRYGLAANPFAQGLAKGPADASLVPDTNVYYRRTLVQNIS